MENSSNPTGTNDINNLTSLKFFSIAMAIQKNLCLAFHSYHLFLKRKELLELPLRKNLLHILNQDSTGTTTTITESSHTVFAFIMFQNAS